MQGRSITLTLACVALAACGGEAETAGTVASLDAGAETTAGEAESTETSMSQADVEDAMLAFTECMREHGIDMPDPEFSNGGVAVVVESEEAGDEEEFAAADEACRHLMEDALPAPEALDPEEIAEMQDQMLAFAECMREHGIDMPDPQVDASGRVEIGFDVGSQGPDEAAVQAANEACMEELGMEGGFIGVGPAPD